MKRPALLAVSIILLLITTFLAFSPILKAGFTNWDDQIMVTQNDKIATLNMNSLATYFTTFHERLYHPLVLITYALEFKFFGLNPFVFHLTSLVLHLLTTALTFWFIYLICGNILVAFITGLLFGIHPMHIESVCWIAERKDVLYAFFFMGSLVSYMGYLRSNKKQYLWLTMLLFILSLLSKSMAMTLPLLLILCDYIAKRNIDTRSLFEKVPYFILSFIFGALTVLGHYEPGVKGREFHFSLINNISAACQNTLFYIIRFFAPFKLSCLYPMPEKMGTIPPVIFVWAPMIVLIIAVAAYFIAKRSRIAAFGFLFFLFALLPVSQILPVGLAIPADRYTYIPYIGLSYILAEGLAWLINRIADKKTLKISLIALLISIAFGMFSLTWQRVHVWQDSFKLWNDCVKNYPIATAYYNLGEEYFLRNWELDKGIYYYTKAIEADPEHVEAYVNRGLIYYYKNNYKEAIKNYNYAEKLDPKLTEISLNRGNAYNSIGKKDLALRDYNKALELKPSQAEGWYNRGNLFLGMKRYDEAIPDYSQAIKIKSNYPDAYNNRGNAYFSKGDLDKAFYDFTMTIMLAPNYGNAYYNRALIYNRKNDYLNAYNDAVKARSLGIKIEDKVLQQLKDLAEKQMKTITPP
jgi:protein O-mannosyl-transferase